MASRWNLWVWLECIGVVSGCCCKEVFRYPHNNYYSSQLHLFSSFFGSRILLYFFVHFLNVFFNLQSYIAIIIIIIISVFKL